MTGVATMMQQNEYVLRLIEQMGSTLRVATQRFSEGASAQESLDATNQAIAMAVELPAELFVRMSPQSMASLLDISSADDRMVEKVAEALQLQADVFQSEGFMIEANVRREQAAAVRDSIDPMHAN
jgi:hypothetical protein